MPSYSVLTAFGDAGIGVDLFAGEVWARTPQNRVITNIGVAGSTAAGDTELDLMVDEVRIGNYFNTTGGIVQPKFDDKIPLENLSVPGGAQLRMVVRDNPPANMTVALVVEDA